MTTPFVIYALPRSRTAWLSALLSYREWKCYHEQAMYMRSMDDARKFFVQENVGAADTAAIHGRYLIRHAVHNVREVVILRPVDEVINALLKVDIAGVARYDEEILRRNMEYGYRALQKAVKDSAVLSVNYADLDREDVCAAIFEHCLPYRFDKVWWEFWRKQNIQINIKNMFNYYFKNKAAVEDFKRQCKCELRRLFRAGELMRIGT